MTVSVIFDLADKTRENLENEFSNLFADYDYFNERTGALKMFEHIKENQIFYKTYFKLCYDDQHLISIYDTKRAVKEHINKNIKYHIEFFRNGLNAIIKLWLAGGCRETPEEMAEEAYRKLSSEQPSKRRLPGQRSDRHKIFLLTSKLTLYIPPNYSA